MEFNALVWAKGKDALWHKGKVVARDELANKFNIKVSFEDGGEDGVYVLTPEQAEEGEGTGDLKLRNVKGQASVEEGADVLDLVVLTHLHEPAILYTLEERYNQDNIYTYTGPILLAINPFFRVGLYSNQILQEYRAAGEKMVFDPEFQSGLPPHVYAVADNAYRLMTHPTSDTQKRNQSILVSGESGAGKTETTKIIMRYLAILGGHNKEAILKGDESVVSIEQQVLQSNPILEAFGNARTVRNDNSSRFGKFIEIDFDSEGFLAGAAIRTFLLEKIRLVHTSEGERNFHVFYLMLAGGTSEEKGRWKLSGDPRLYHYINQSNCYKRRDGVKDADLWAELKHAMKVMDVAETEMEEVFRTVAGVLNGGNMNFSNILDKSRSSEPVGELTAEAIPYADKAAELLYCTRSALVDAMTFRKIQAGREWFTMYMDATKANHYRNALCKAIYAGLFDWLVAKINETIDKQRGGTGAGPSSPLSNKSGQGGFTWGSSPKSTSPAGNGSAPFSDNMFIGLLDIFGFESFEHNYFEQFLINYANEKLQQQFNHFVFEMEQEEYKREGIKWDFIEFPDNKDSIELIETKPAGVLSLLDEQCLFPKASDQTFANAMYKHLEKHSRFKAPNDLKVDYKFMVNHYAGDITYHTEGFLEKNRDLLHPEGIDLLKSSNSELLHHIARSARAESAASQMTSTRNLRHSSILSLSVGAQFKNQLNHLLSAIDDTHPHYIRCLKPNDKNVRSNFNIPRITAQLANGGVLAAVHVARAGFPVRMGHGEFVRRYGILALDKLPKAWKTARQEFPAIPDQEREVAKVLIYDVVPQLTAGQARKNSIGLAAGRRGPNNARVAKAASFRDMCGEGGLQLGQSKVFFRQVAFNRAEKARTIKLTASITLIQKCFRRWRRERWYRTLRKGTVRFQARARGAQARTRYQAMRYLHATLLVQKFVRACCRRREYNRMRAGAVNVQTWYRGATQRKKFVQRRARVVLLQCQWRRKVAVGEAKELRRQRNEVNALQARVAQFEAMMAQREAEMNRAKEEAIAKALADVAARAAEQEAERAAREVERAAKAEADRKAAEALAAEQRLAAESAAQAAAAQRRVEEDERAVARAAAEERLKQEREAADALAAERAAAAALGRGGSRGLRRRGSDDSAGSNHTAGSYNSGHKQQHSPTVRGQRQRPRPQQMHQEEEGGEDDADAFMSEITRQQSSKAGKRLQHHRYPSQDSSGVVNEYDDMDEDMAPGGISPTGSAYSTSSFRFDDFTTEEELSSFSIAVPFADVRLQDSRPGRPVGSPFVAYTIVVKTLTKQWKVVRRFSDFVWLHNMLCDAYPSSTLPTLPSRRMLQDTLSAEFVDIRRMGLQDYLVDLFDHNNNERAKWLAERDGSASQIKLSSSKKFIQELQAKQALKAFVDKRQKSLEREEDTNVTSMISSAFSSLWKRF